MEIYVYVESISFEMVLLVHSGGRTRETGSATSMHTLFLVKLRWKRFM